MRSGPFTSSAYQSVSYISIRAASANPDRKNESKKVDRLLRRLMMLPDFDTDKDRPNNLGFWEFIIVPNGLTRCYIWQHGPKWHLVWMPAPKYSCHDPANPASSRWAYCTSASDTMPCRSSNVTNHSEMFSVAPWQRNFPI
jgi:hypothetical protein